jgi:cytidyltransferase-like protein
MFFDKLVNFILEGLQPQRTIAIVPGAYRPPHKGHFEMIEQYSKIADKVMVLISPDNQAAKANRLTPSGKYISADLSKQIWDIYIQNSGLNNVIINIATSPSPIGAAFEFVENKDNDINKAQPGEHIILGVSTKGGDEKRFAISVQKYAREGVTVEAIPVTPKSNLSATDFRIALGKTPNDLIPFLPEHVIDKAKEIFQLLA